MKRTIILVLLSLFIFTSLDAAPSSAQEESNYEIVFWETIKDSKDPKLYQMYLDKYPDGAFAEVAQILLIKYLPQENQKAAPPPQQTKEKLSQVKEERMFNKVAIFPVKFYDDADYMKGILLNDLTLVADRFDCIKFSHSYYELDARYVVKNLSDRKTIDPARLRTRDLWNGNNPNSVNISKIGKDLGIDAVLTGSLRVTNPWSDKYTLGYIRIFMVDVATGKIFKASNSSTTGDARDYVNRIVQRVMQNYAGEFCR